jgi:hypothetical protein
MLGPPPRASIPDDLDPAARFVLQTIHDKTTDELAMWRVEAGAGLGQDTIRAWHYPRGRYGPSIGTVRAALRELGYDLAVVPYRDPDR